MAGARVCRVHRKQQGQAGSGNHQLRQHREIYGAQAFVNAEKSGSIHRPSLAGLETVSALGGSGHLRFHGFGAGIDHRHRNAQPRHQNVAGIDDHVAVDAIGRAHRAGNREPCRLTGRRGVQQTETGLIFDVAVGNEIDADPGGRRAAAPAPPATRRAIRRRRTGWLPRSD